MGEGLDLPLLDLILVAFILVLINTHCGGKNSKNTRNTSTNFGSNLFTRIKGFL